ncbi:MAG TPA: MarC family protein [Verrucomicrobiae bacterium]|nr:MarC family protein [Verrucomicrobiae bacterium]
MPELSEYVKILLSLVVLVDPIGAIPLFISVTEAHPELERKRTAKIACIAFTTVLVVSIVAGKAVLSIFGVSISSFKVGGGILILLMAIAMMEASRVPSKHTAEEDTEAEVRDSPAVVPLAIPFLAGPGAISTVIIYAERSHAPPHMLMLALCCVVTGGISYLALRGASRISGILGKTGINVAVRLMGLFLAAIAVEFIAGGVGELFPGLLR